MLSDWATVDVGRDPTAWARLLRRAYTRAAGGGRPSTIVRPVVADSWARCVGAAVEIDGLAPYVRDGDDAGRALETHPLHGHLDVLEDLLVGVARYAHQIVIVTDAAGNVLWVSGHEPTVASARRLHLAPGACWDEAGAGTNAIGTALQLGRPVQIFSAEHYRAALHGWSASAAPVRDPAGRTLGTISLAGPYRAAHPHGFALVAATANLIEGALERATMDRRERLTAEFLQRVLPQCRSHSALVGGDGAVLVSTPAGWLGPRLEIDADGLPVPPNDTPVHVEVLDDAEGFLLSDAAESARTRVLRLNALGTARAVAWVDGRRVELTLRHSELLVALALHPDGLDEAGLASAVYERDDVKAVTVRAEISRLRKLLGPVLKTRPYRLAADVRADFLAIERALPVGSDANAKLQRYQGPLLPASNAPAVVAARRRLAEAVDDLSAGAEPELAAPLAG